MTTLDDARAFIRALSSTLDPKSRYVTELDAVVAASKDLGDLVARLTKDSRGQRHAGRAVFERMTVEEKLRCNLITNETVLFRFTEGEWLSLQRFLERFPSTEVAKILCAPCSHGEEAFSLAAACLQGKVGFAIDAFDVQPACIAAARTGRLTMGFPEAYLDSAAVLSREVLSRIRFEVGDLLRAPESEGAVRGGPWDLVICRNFLGYFVPEQAQRITVGLARSVQSQGLLFLDSFCLGKFPGLAAAVEQEGLTRVAGTPVFARA